MGMHEHEVEMTMTSNVKDSHPTKLQEMVWSAVHASWPSEDISLQGRRGNCAWVIQQATTKFLFFLYNKSAKSVPKKIYYVKKAP